MRIAVLAPLVSAIREPQRGGSQALVADICRGLGERGHRVRLYAASGSQVPGVDVVDTGVDPATLADTLFRAGRQGVVSEAAQGAFARAWECIATDAPDIAHNHAFDAPAIGQAPESLRVLHTLHLPPTEDVARAVRAAQERAAAPCVAVVSRSQERLWSARVRVDAVLRNGVPVRRMGWSADGGPAAVYAGRLSPEKGVVDAIKIARAAGVPLEVVGDPYDPAYAEREIVPHATRDVRMHPAEPRERLWERMGCARAVLCPIRWEEPFGLVAAEAQACGTPVVGFRRGALAEVIADGRTGLLVPEGDTEAAARALAGAVAFDRRACRAHAERSLDLEAVLDAHERLYADVCAGHMPSGSGRVEGS